MKKFRERNLVIIAAIGAVFLLVAAYLALNFSHLPLISHQRSYSADFSSAVGLQPGDVVTIAGVRVGKVTGFSLDGDAARVKFVITGSERLGIDTTVDTKVLNPVGVEYLELNPSGPGRLQGTIPLSRTTTPGTLVGDLNDVGKEIAQTNLNQLVESLNVVTQAMDATSPAETKAAIDGVADLSAVLASKQSEVDSVIVSANQLTGLLNAHSTQLVSLLGESNLLLSVLQAREAAINNLLDTTTELSSQVDHLISDDRSVLDPALTNLQAVSAFLAQDSSDVKAAIPLLAAFTRYSANIAGSGPFVDTVAPTLFVPDNVIAQCAADPNITELLGCR